MFWTLLKNFLKKTTKYFENRNIIFYKVKNYINPRSGSYLHEKQKYYFIIPIIE
jgi:hypothetical protein